MYFLRSNGSREGPYVIATVPSTGKYTLCRENGQAVENGQEISLDCLEAAT